MSEEKQFNSVMQEIKDIYEFLIKGEPTPDDEIEARTNLMEVIHKLQNINYHQVKMNQELLEETYDKLEKWDTLDLWFTESEIPDHIKKVMALTDIVPEIEFIEEEKEVVPEEKIESEAPSIDIKEIVDQVSDKFKGEIENLKQKIDYLQHEIDEKDQKLKQASQKKVVKIVPKKNVQLPPPKIKIPTIKKPEKAPQILGQIKTKETKSREKIGVKSIEAVQMKIEEEIGKLKPLPSSPLTPAPLHPSQPSPIPIRPVAEESKDSSSILDILDEQETEYIEETPKKPLISTEVSLVEEKLKEQNKIPPFLIQDQDKREVEMEHNIAQTPKISSVSVEEIETEPIKSTGTELFDVFSTAGDRRAEKLIHKSEITSAEPIKEPKKKETKKKKKESDAVSFVGFGTEEQKESAKGELATVENYTQVSIDELPKDKDSLYQELIALEGRRYSLEKNYKELERSYNGGSISDIEYRNRSEDLKNKQQEITSQINRIRRVIASI
ncbi:MAG: hypothetical protein ACFFE4_19245 [Candidatus Thorarchaeota archaeon]